jgi:photosystem II stability/assembly factor-like uncharacterized protein
MKASFLILVLLFTVICKANAQNTIVTNQDEAIYCGGSVQLSTNVMPASIDSHTTNVLSQIFFYNQDTGFIVGTNGTILRTTDGGHVWDLTTFQEDQNWCSVYCVSATTAFIASLNGGRIAKTTDRGSSWNVVYSNPFHYILKLAFLNESKGFAVGFDGFLLRTDDGGNNWHTVAGGNPSLLLSDITFVNETTGFITESYNVNTSPLNILLRTTDGGNTWTELYQNPSCGFMNRIEFANENLGYLVTYNKVFRTIDGGNTWNTFINQKEFWQIALCSDSVGYLSKNYEIYKFSDAGALDIFYRGEYSSPCYMSCPTNQSVFWVSNQGNINSYHTPISYHWEPSAGLSADDIPNPMAFPDQTTTYTVSVPESDGLTASDTVTVYVGKSPFTPIICRVTVDSVSSHNKIVWNAPDFSAADSVYVFKEGNMANYFSRLAAFPASEPGQFIDFESNAEVQSNRYALSISDRCSFESDLGTPHKTMHLSINKGMDSTWNLIWEKYEGAEVYSYNIYRGPSPDALQYFTTVSGSNSHYSDLHVSGTVYYQIEAVLNAQCNLKSASSSFSNIDKTKPANGVGDEYVYAAWKAVNPVTDKLSFQGKLLPDIYSISFFSMNGQVVREWAHPVGSSFDVSGLPSGIYLLKVEVDDTHRGFVQKVVKD